MTKIVIYLTYKQTKNIKFKLINIKVRNSYMYATDDRLGRNIWKREIHFGLKWRKAWKGQERSQKIKRCRQNEVETRYIERSALCQNGARSTNRLDGEGYCVDRENVNTLSNIKEKHEDQLDPTLNWQLWVTGLHLCENKIVNSMRYDRIWRE